MPSNDRSAPPITQPPQAGHHYSLMQVAAIAAAFVLATIALNLMPLIISATMSFLSMGEASVGAITSLELLIMSATTFVLAPWAPRLVSKYLVIIAVCLVVVAQGATLLATSTQSFSLIRVLAGIGAGLLLLGANTRVASHRDPVRLYGVCTVAGALVSMLLFSVLPSLMSEYGHEAMFITLACLGLLILPLQFFFPRSESMGQEKSSEASKLPMALFALIIFALFVIQLTQASYFAFVERMAVSIHQLSPQAIGGLLGGALLAAMVGSSLATWLGQRWGQLVPLVLGLGGHGLAVMITCFSNDALMFNVGIIAQALFYFFSIPYQLGLAAQLDPSGRLASVGAAVFFFGMSCGPVLGGWLVETWSYAAIAWAVMLGLVAGLGILSLLIKRHTPLQSGEENLDKPRAVFDT